MYLMTINFICTGEAQNMSSKRNKNKTKQVKVNTQKHLTNHINTPHIRDQVLLDRKPICNGNVFNIIRNTRPRNRSYILQHFLP